MNYGEAMKAIADILDQIDIGDLPHPEKRDDYAHDKYGTCYWFGGHGYFVGAARDGKGRSIPNNHRRSGVDQLLELEYMQRLEDNHWAERVAR